jgi:alginate O-acetyltransferase complex protein AlgI
MVFSNLFFIYGFMAVTLVLYFLCRSITQKNIIVVLMSLVFYAWGEPTYVWLLILSTTINYCVGLLIEKFRDKPKSSKAVLVIALIINLGFLGVFKYSGFIVENLNAWFGLGLPVPDVALPILYFPNDILHSRLLLGKRRRSKELPKVSNVRVDVPTTSSWTNSPLQCNR